jgi:uncharacterized protein
MLFRDKRQDKVIETIDGYCALVGGAVEKYVEMVNSFLDGEEQFKEASRAVHELESQADEVRFSVEREMYRGAFLPAYREDYIGLLETLDRVANKAEDAADLVFLIRPDVPPDVAEALREIARITARACEPLITMVHKTLLDDFDVQDQVELIGRLEQEIDRIQFNAVRDAYRNPDLEKVDKLILKMVIDAIAEVSDKLENVGDKLSLIALKRKLG